jgi:hypothetical protein
MPSRNWKTGARYWSSPQGRQRHPDRRGAEADEREGGHDAGRREQGRVPGALLTEGRLALSAQPQQIGQRGQELDRGLGGQ